MATKNQEKELEGMTEAEKQAQMEKNKKTEETASPLSKKEGKKTEIEDKSKEDWWKEQNIDTNSRYEKVGGKWLDEKQHKHWMGLSNPRAQNEYLNSIQNKITDEDAAFLNNKNTKNKEKPATIKNGPEYTDEQLKELNKKADKNQEAEDDSFNKATGSNVNNTSGYLHDGGDELHLTSAQYHSGNTSITEILNAAEEAKWNADRTRKYIDTLYPDGWTPIAKTAWENSKFGRDEAKLREKMNKSSEADKPVKEETAAQPSATSNNNSNTASKPVVEDVPEERDVKEDMDTLIKAKNEIARLEAELANTSDPEERKRIKTQLEDAKGRFSTITDYYQLDMDQILNYGKEGKEVEDAVRSNHENEGWLTNAWVKQARRARAKKNAIQKEIKAAKEAGKDTTALEAQLRDAKDELSSIHSKYSYFLFDAIRTGLKNMAIPGAYGHGPGNEQSLWDKTVGTNLEADLNRHNKARDASVQELIDGLANRHGADAEQVKAANDLLNNEKAVRQASRLGILDSLDKLESAISMKNKLGIQNWEDAVWIMQLMGYDPTAAATTSAVNKIIDTFKGGSGKEKQ